MGVRRAHHAQPGGQAELRLGALGVVLDRADAAAERDADDRRHRHDALAAGVQLGDLADDLVVGGVHEAVELDLHDRAVAAQHHAHRGADDPGLPERGVDHPVLAEVLLQALGHAEDATERADVLTHDDDLGVGLHGGPQAGVDGLAEAEPLADGRRPLARARAGAHAAPPSVSNDAR